MRQFGLIGYPLTHSFSKKYFSEKFEREAITDCTYENFSIASINELPALIKDHPSLHGINVTIPYKEQVIPYLSHQSEVVKQIKACNCIKIKNGMLTGHNTDVTGFEVSLKTKLDKHHHRALILGTGGAAKAAEYVLLKLGIESVYVSRKSSDNILSYHQLTSDIISAYTLIINTTPLGMYPNVDEYPPIPYQFLGSRHYLYDLIYNPGKTVFLKRGEEKGAVIKSGDDMLLIQAEESWKIWNDIKL